MKIDEKELENTPTGGVLIGKKDGQTIIHDEGTMSGYLVGKLHKDGGIKAVNKSTGQPLEMQGGEVVITAPAVSDQTKREFEGKMMTNREILSAINEKGGGVSFAKGGDVPKSFKTIGASYKYGGKIMKDHEILNAINGSGHLSKGKSLKQIAEMHNVSLTHINKELAKGLEVEKEHLADFKERTRVAKDHLVENPNYYSILAKAGLKDGGILKIPNVSHTDLKGKEFTFQKGKFLIVDFPNHQGSWKKNIGASWRKTAKHYTSVIKLDNIKTDLDSILWKKFQKPFFVFDDFFNQFENKPSFSLDGDYKKMTDFLNYELKNFKRGGKLEKEDLVKDAKSGNTPARDLNNYNDVMDLQADEAVGGDSGLAFADGGKLDDWFEKPHNLKGIANKSPFEVTVTDLYCAENIKNKHKQLEIIKLVNPRVEISVTYVLVIKNWSSVDELKEILTECSGNISSYGFTSNEQIEAYKRMSFADGGEIKDIEPYFAIFNRIGLSGVDYVMKSQVNFDDFRRYLENAERGIENKYVGYEKFPFHDFVKKYDYVTKIDFYYSNQEHKAEIDSLVEKLKKDGYTVLTKTYSFTKGASQGFNKNNRAINVFAFKIKSFAKGGVVYDTTKPKVEKVTIKSSKTDRVSIVGRNASNIEEFIQIISDYLKNSTENYDWINFYINDNKGGFYIDFNKNKRNTVKNVNPENVNSINIKRVIDADKYLVKEYNWNGFFLIKEQKSSSIQEKKEIEYPEFYEFIQDTDIEFGSGFTKGKIYKIIDPKNLEKGNNFIDDKGHPNGYGGENAKKFKPSTKEAYEAQEGIITEIDYPEYYEYTSSDDIGSDGVVEFTKGKIYKIINPKNLKDLKNFIDDKGKPNGYGSENYLFFKPSTKEAYEAQQVTEEGTFEIKEDEDLTGRWLKCVKKNNFSSGKGTPNIGDFIKIIGRKKDSNNRDVLDMLGKSKLFALTRITYYKEFKVMPKGFSPEEVKETIKAKETKFDFSNTKINVKNNRNLSLRVQQKAFDSGWEWEKGAGGGKVLNSGNFNYLYFTKTSISYGSSYDSFRNSPKKEITEQDIFNSDLGISTDISKLSKERVKLLLELKKIVDKENLEVLPANIVTASSKLVGEVFIDLLDEGQDVVTFKKGQKNINPTDEKTSKILFQFLQFLKEGFSPVEVKVAKQQEGTFEVKVGDDLTGRWLKCVKENNWSSGKGKPNVGDYLKIVDGEISSLTGFIDNVTNKKGYNESLSVDRIIVNKEFQVMPLGFSPEEAKETIKSKKSTQEGTFEIKVGDDLTGRWLKCVKEKHYWASEKGRPIVGDFLKIEKGKIESLNFGDDTIYVLDTLGKSNSFALARIIDRQEFELMPEGFSPEEAKETIKSKETKTLKLSNLKKGDRFSFALTQEDIDLGITETNRLIYVFDSEEKSTTGITYYYYKSGDDSFNTSTNLDVNLVDVELIEIEKPIYSKPVRNFELERKYFHKRIAELSKELDMKKPILSNEEIGFYQREINNLITKLRNINEEEQSLIPIKERLDKIFSLKFGDFDKQYIETDLTSPNGIKSELTEEEYFAIRTDGFKSFFGDWMLAIETNNYNGISKVINPKTKEPLAVWHGTNVLFTEWKTYKTNNAHYFAVKREMSEFFAKSWESRTDKAAVDSKALKSLNPNKGKYLFKCFLDIKNPVDFSRFGVEKRPVKEFLLFLKINYNIGDYDFWTKAGNMFGLAPDAKVYAWQIIRNWQAFTEYIKTFTTYDGYIFYEYIPDKEFSGLENASLSFCAFESNQIKFDNAVEFNALANDSRFNLGGNI
jgi:hypothetical protein